jgi:hypothetical protein
MPHPPHAHHETSEHNSANETKIKEKQNEPVPDSNSNLTMSMTHHNQTKELTTWFFTDTSGRDPLLIRWFGWEWDGFGLVFVEAL